VIEETKKQEETSKADSWHTCENHLLFLIKSRMIDIAIEYKTPNKPNAMHDSA
jgi:hypothetical protein